MQVSISQTTFTGNTADKETAVAVTGDAQVCRQTAACTAR